MALSTYNDLTAAVKSWLHRDDLAAQIPDFIALAEEKLSRVLRIPQMETYATVAVPDSGEAPLPANLAELIRVSDAEGNYLIRVPLRDLSNAILRQPTEKFYAVKGTALVVRPKPAVGKTADYVVEYFAKPAPLSSSNQTNLWTSIASDALLYGALLEASAWLYDDPRVPLWQQRFDAAIAAIQAALESSVDSPQYGLRYAPANGVV